jgi:hypothetical protein
MGDKRSRSGAAERSTGYTHRWMDPLDHLLALPDGHPCSVCEERVPAARVKILAWRDDLAFLQIDCGSCFSTTLGFMLGGRSEEPATRPMPAPISADDLLDMHQLLASWRGDLTELFSKVGPGPAEPGR